MRPGASILVPPDTRVSFFFSSFILFYVLLRTRLVGGEGTRSPRLNVSGLSELAPVFVRLCIHEVASFSVE